MKTMNTQAEDARADGNLRSGYRATIVAASEMTICGVPTGRLWCATQATDISRMSVAGSRVSAIRSTVVWPDATSVRRHKAGYTPAHWHQP